MSRNSLTGTRWRVPRSFVSPPRVDTPTGLLPRCCLGTGVLVMILIPFWGWSRIPGGVISGASLVKPDDMELTKFPFLWYQTEYVIGGVATFGQRRN